MQRTRTLISAAIILFLAACDKHPEVTTTRPSPPPTPGKSVAEAKKEFDETLAQLNAAREKFEKGELDWQRSRPTPVTIEQVEELLAKRVPVPTPSPRASLVPAFDNPWETDEDRAVKVRRKYGLRLVEADGTEYGRIHRKDGDDIAKGVTSGDFVMESAAQPTVTKVGEKWETVLTNEVPTPAPTATPN